MIKILNQNITLKHLIFCLFLSSAIALTSAYISQYIFNYQPCVLCLYQRKPFFAIIAISLISLTLLKSSKSQKITFFLCLILLLINSGIATYHVGVEEKIFTGPSTCAGAKLNESQSLEELKLALLKAPSVKCNEPQFYLLGLTMATWNLIFCLLLVIFSWIFYQKVKHYDK